MGKSAFSVKNDTSKIEVDTLDDGGVAIALFEDYLDQYADIVLTKEQTAALTKILRDHVKQDT